MANTSAPWIGAPGFIGNLPIYDSDEDFPLDASEFHSHFEEEEDEGELPSVQLAKQKPR